jgi:hypothetical protein
MQMQDDNLLPCQVVAYDVTNNWATVQPLVQLVDVQNNTVDRFPLVQIPCLALGAGNGGVANGNGFIIHFPITKGDLGWIFAADRDLTLFKQQLSKCAPQTGRLHQFADGMFMPDIFRQYTIASGDVGRLCIQTTQGDQKITIGTDGHIEITATTTVHITTPLVECTQNLQVDGNLKVLGTSEQVGACKMDATLEVVGNITGDANMAIAGNITANSGAVSMSGGTMTIPNVQASSNVTVGGKSVAGHVHADLHDGGNTGPF